MDNSKDHEKIAKEIAKTSDSIRKKYHALKTVKWRISHWRDTQTYYRSTEIDWKHCWIFQVRILLWNILFRRRWGTKTQKKKRPNALYDNPIQASTSVKSMLSRKPYYPLWTKCEIIQPRFIVWPCSHRRRNFRGYRWTVRNIYSIHALNIRGERKAAYKLWSIGTKITESSPER